MQWHTIARNEMLDAEAGGPEVTLMARGGYPLGPECGWLRLHVFREGVLSALGHDLVLEAGEWSGKLDADPARPDEAVVEVTVPIASLFVREAQGGLRKLTTDDEAKIRERIALTLRSDEHPSIDFLARGVSSLRSRDGGGFGDGVLGGTLAISGRAEPLDVRFAFTRQPDGIRITGGADVVQTKWGLTPYNGLHLGLRVRDTVEVYFDILIAQVEVSSQGQGGQTDAAG